MSGMITEFSLEQSLSLPTEIKCEQPPLIDTSAYNTNLPQDFYLQKFSLLLQLVL